MSTAWGLENIVADHRELQANTMALDSAGQHAILAGRRHMGIIQLDSPTVVVHKTVRNSKWDVTTARWSPHKKECFALACNQRAELYCWENADVKQIASLKAHMRAISDLDWSIFDNNTLATASIDTYIHLWDLRETRKPQISLSAVAGASQVKWNKKQEQLLATSHEGDVRIWDIRKSKSPVQYITAHLNKIHNIDWCPYEENILATSSQDCTVKFWDVTVPIKMDETLQVPCPVWRAQYTPFGYGLVTVVVPPLRRGDNSLLLWNMKNCSTPVHTFFGHSDVVVEFGWRKPSGDSKYFQLVTFAKDHTLRTWVVDRQLQKICGQFSPEEDEAVLEPLDTGSVAIETAAPTSQPANAVTPQKPRTLSISQPHDLEQEFSLVNLNIPCVDFYEMDAKFRTCTAVVDNGKYVVTLEFNFPITYPLNDPPTFEFRKVTNVNEETKAKVSKVIKMVAHQQVRRNRSCLEPCLRQVVRTLDNIANEDRNLPLTPESPFHADVPKPSFSGPANYVYPDVSVPFPRTSGARFCGADILVVFTRPYHLQRINAPTDDTPRSLSALSAYLTAHSMVMAPQSPSADNPVSLSSFYHEDRKTKKRRNLHDRRSSGSKLSNSGAVLIYSISKLMPINFNLAQSYVFGSDDIVATCSKNAAIAAKEGCRDLVQVWSLASLICNPSSMSMDNPENAHLWANHPFGRKTLQSLIFHYGNHYDVQTAAMLACIFHVKSPESKAKKAADATAGGSLSCASSFSKVHDLLDYYLRLLEQKHDHTLKNKISIPGGSPYHTVVPSNNSFEGWSIVGAALKRNRSNSWSDSVEEYSFFEDPTNRNGSGDFRIEERDTQENSSRLLDPVHSHQFDQYKRVYADVLYRWNLLEQRAQVLKTVSTPPEKHKGIDFFNECRYCKKDVTGAQCQSCKKYSFSCVICKIAVKGCSSFCMVCGHGGHTKHLQEWFADMDVCPSGCGCKCLEENDIFGD